MLAQYAPKGVDGNPENLKTSEGLIAAGFDVSYAGPEVDDCDNHAGADEDGDILVDAPMFSRWLELSQLALGTAVAKWWSAQEPSAEGCIAGLRQDWDERPADFLGRIRDQLAAESKTKPEGVPLRALVAWLRENVGDSFNVGGEADEETLVNQMLL